MSKGVKILLIVAACVAALGLLLIGIGMVSGTQQVISEGFKLAERVLYDEEDSVIATPTPGTVDHASNPAATSAPVASKDSASKSGSGTDITAFDLPAFDRVIVDVTVADVSFVLDERPGISIQYSDERHNPSYSVENGVLRIKDDPYKVSWNGKSFKEILQDLASFNSLVGGGKITVFLTEQEYKSISATTVDGDISISGLNAAELSLETVNGLLLVESGTYRDTEAESINGEIILKGEFRGEVSIENINGTLLMESSLHETNYKFDLHTVNGNTNINGQKHGAAYQGGTGSFDIEASTINGDIDLRFGSNG